jgi:hypothetical protein
MRIHPEPRGNQLTWRTSFLMALSRLFRGQSPPVLLLYPSVHNSAQFLQHYVADFRPAGAAIRSTPYTFCGDRRLKPAGWLATEQPRLYEYP